MKYLLLIPYLLCSICFFQIEKEQFELSYIAQTRGFKYVIEVKNDSIFKEINGNQQVHLLKDNQKKEIITLIDNIQFKDLKDNLDRNQLLVDATIKGTLLLNNKGDKHQIEFDHNNLPKQLEELLNKLENFE